MADTTIDLNDVSIDIWHCICNYLTLLDAVQLMTMTRTLYQIKLPNSLLYTCMDNHLRYSKDCHHNNMADSIIDYFDNHKLIFSKIILSPKWRLTLSKCNLLLINNYQYNFTIEHQKLFLQSLMNNDFYTIRLFIFFFSPRGITMKLTTLFENVPENLVSKLHVWINNNDYKQFNLHTVEYPLLVLPCLLSNSKMIKYIFAILNQLVSNGKKIFNQKFDRLTVYPRTSFSQPIRKFLAEKSSENLNMYDEIWNKNDKIIDSLFDSFHFSSDED
jgi:hypothetical protein